MNRFGVNCRTIFPGVAAWLVAAAALAVDPESRHEADSFGLPSSSGIAPSTSVEVPAETIPELLHRLQAAELRIAELEVSQTEGSTEPAPSRDGRKESAAAGEVPDSESDIEADQSAEESLAERLEALEGDWQEYQDELQAAEDEGAGTPTVEIGGRIHLDYWSALDDSEGAQFFEHPVPGDPQFGTDTEDRFLFRRIRLEMEGNVPDLMFWRVQVDFNTPADPQIKDVYLGWELPYDERLIVGHQKLPMSLDALYSSRFAPFMERPQVADAFVTDFRRLGILMRGYSDERLFNWGYGVFNMQDIQESGAYIGDSLQLGGVGRLASTPWYDEASSGRGYLHLGISASVVRPDGDVTSADSNENVARFAARPEGRTDRRWIDTGPIRGAEWFEQTGLEGVLNIGAAQLTGEFMTTWVQRDSVTEGTGPDVYFHGGYVQGTYFLTGEYFPWDRETGVIERVRPLENFFLIDRCRGGTGGGWGAWQAAARYDYLDITDGDIRGGVQNNLTLGLNWWWNPYARLQFNVTRGIIEQHRPVGGFESGHFWIAGTRFAIDF